MATIILPTPIRVYDLSGYSLPGAKLWCHDSGTTTPRIVYSDPECQFPHEQPLIADGAGVFPAIYDNVDRDMRVTVTTTDDVVLPGYPVDPAPRVTTNETGARSIQFSPTANIPETNLQDAVERVQDNIVQPLLDYGLGVTGNAPLIGDIDATNIASGFYRFATGTTGTFPSGIIADTGGMVHFLRGTSSMGMQYLISGDSRRVYLRRLMAGSWQPWSRLMDSADTEGDPVWAAGASSTPAVPTPANIRAAIESHHFGAGQTWQNVTGSRGRETIYNNTTGRPIYVSIALDGSSAIPAQVQVRPIGTGTWITIALANHPDNELISAIIPNGYQYRARAGDAMTHWAELR